jgi:hypothetical protein
VNAKGAKESISATIFFLYTSENCNACPAMKKALDALGVRYTEIKLYNGMVLPPDVRSIPTLAAERDGKRTTICTCWPGSVERLEKILTEKGVTIKKEKRNERH